MSKKMTIHQRKKLLEDILKGPYNLSQREQLILGNLDGVNFWEYADPDISFLQMEEMRKEMRAKLSHTRSAS